MQFFFSLLTILKSSMYKKRNSTYPQHECAKYIKEKLLTKLIDRNQKICVES